MGRLQTESPAMERARIFIRYLEAYNLVETPIKASADRMLAIIDDSTATAGEQERALRTLEEILFPPESPTPAG